MHISLLTGVPLHCIFALSITPTKVPCQHRHHHYNTKRNKPTFTEAQIFFFTIRTSTSRSTFTPIFLFHGFRFWLRFGYRWCHCNFRITHGGIFTRRKKKKRRMSVICINKKRKQVHSKSLYIKYLPCIT